MQGFSESPSLTHISPGGEVQMVDVSAKPVTPRRAIAKGQVQMAVQTLASLQAGNGPKGDVVTTAKLAGIMAAKETARLIPLCHPLPLTQIDVTLTPNAGLPGYDIMATVSTQGKTGVEMEALTAVSVAALTLYDMAKALDPAMVITHIHLWQKTGGQSGDYINP